LYIDISSVAELTTKQFDGKSLVLGANTTLTEAIEIFTQIAKDNPNFAYLKLMADHIDLIANVPVRNVNID
jgi:xanthine dehydrogenase/oxidase